MKKALKIFIFILMLLVLILGILFIYKLYNTDAPITHGEHTHHKYDNDLGLDIYLPTKQVFDKAPILFYIHGGGWIVGSKISVNNDRFYSAFNELRDVGFCIIAPDYTLAAKGASPFPGCIDDIKNAIKWVNQQAEDMSLDKNRMGIIGESAGAHISLMVAYDEKFSETFPLDYIIDIYGPTSLYQLYKDQIPLIDSIQSRVAHLPACFSEALDLPNYLFGMDPTIDTLKAKTFANQYSPALHIKKHQKIPIMMIHGQKDRLVPINQMKILQERLEKHELHYTFHELENVDHAFIGISDKQKTNVQLWIKQFVLNHYN